MVVAAACRPHVRFGDIEPAAGERVLVDAHVRTAREDDVDPRIVGASGDPMLADAAFAPLPVIGAETVIGELGSNVQGLSIPASDARVEPAELGVDARRIESIYAARGYFKARTLDWRMVDLDDLRTRVEYEVSEGVPTTIEKVEFVGLTPPEDDPKASEILLELWEELPDLAALKEGEVWTEDGWLKSLATIRAAFRERGFLDCDVGGDTWVSQDVPRAVVQFRVNHGRLARASGEIVVIGASVVPERRIRIRTELLAGAILDASDLRDAEARISELGQFLFVQVRPSRLPPPSDTPPAEPRAPSEPVQQQPTDAPPALLEQQPNGPAPESSQQQLPPIVLPTPVPGGLNPAALGRVAQLYESQRLRLEVEVQEAPEWDFDFGFGGRTDSTQVSFETPLRFTHRNLFGELVTLRSEARPALVFPDAFENGADDLRVGMGARVVLTVPSFFEEFLKFNVTTNYRRDVTQAAGVEEFSGAIDWSRRLGRHLTARAGWNFSYSNFFDRAIFDIVTPEQALDELALRFRRTDALAWLGASIVFDSRDGIFEARRGVFAQLGFDVAETWLGSQAPFERLSFEGRAYLTIPDFELVTFALRVRAGAVFNRTRYGTNESSRFRAGGQSSMRGFAANRMGDYICTGGTDAGPAINGSCSTNILDRLYVGGNFAFETNAELRFNIGDLGLVAFIDIGNLWNRIDDIDFAALHVAVGPGVRLNTPIGPLRFDIGFLLGDNPRREFHIGLGQAF